MFSEFITCSKIFSNFFNWQTLRINRTILSLEQLIEIITHLLLIVCSIVIYVSKWVCLLFSRLLWCLLYILLVGFFLINKLIVVNLRLRSTKIKHILALMIIDLLLIWIVVAIVIEKTQQVRIIWCWLNNSCLCGVLYWLRLLSFLYFNSHGRIPSSIHKWRFIIEI